MKSSPLNNFKESFFFSCNNVGEGADTFNTHVLIFASQQRRIWIVSTVRFCRPFYNPPIVLLLLKDVRTRTLLFICTQGKSRSRASYHRARSYLTPDYSENDSLILSVSDPNSIQSAPFRQGPIKILIHGYTAGKDETPNKEIRPGKINTTFLLPLSGSVPYRSSMGIHFQHTSKVAEK